jgi:uncharacterized protein (TIGR00369 family)
MNQILDAIPYARFLGVQVERSDGVLECVLPFRHEIVGNAALPAVHGGVLGAFLELTALLRLLDESGSERVPKPITFSVDYLRSTGPSTTRACAEIFKLGRRIALVHLVRAVGEARPARVLRHARERRVDALLLGEERAVREAVEGAIDHHVERDLRLPDPAHAVREARGAEARLAEEVTLPAPAEHVLVRHAVRSAGSVSLRAYQRSIHRPTSPRGHSMRAWPPVATANPSL